MEKRWLWQRAAIFVWMIVCIWMVHGSVNAAEINNNGRFEVSVDAESNDKENLLGYPVHVHVTNNGSDFNGIVRLLVYTGSGMNETIAFGKNAEIAANQTETVEFMIENGFFSEFSFQVPIRIDILDENGNQLYKEVIAYNVQSSGDELKFNVGIISQDEGVQKIVNETKIPYSDMEFLRLRSAMLDNANIDNSNFSALHLMIVEKEISDNEWSPISNWVKEGGYLIISKDVYQDRIGKAVDDYQRTSWGKGKIVVCDNDGWTKEKLLDCLKKFSGNIQVENDYLQITVDDDSNEAKDTSYFFETLYNINNHIDFSAMSLALSYDAWSKLMNLWQYVIVIMLYVIIVMPGMYIFLKKKDRKEYFWAAIPISAVIFSVIIYQLGTPTRYKESFAQYANMVELTDEGSIAETVLKVVSPKKVNKVLSLNNRENVSLTPNDYYTREQKFDVMKKALMRETYDVGIVSSNHRDDIFINNQRIFGANEFRFSHITEDNAKLETDITYYKDGFSGTITNHTDWDLNNVFLIHQGLIALVGTVEAGETKEFDYAAAYVISDYEEVKAIDYDVSSYNNVGDASKLKHIMEILTYQTSLSVDSHADDSIVGGFTESYDIGIHEDSQLQSINGVSLVFEKVHITESGDTWKTIPNVTGVGETIEDREYYSSQLYIIYSDKVIHLVYRFDMPYPVTFLKYMNQDDYLDISVYNNETGSYDAIFEGSPVIEGEDLKPYINQNNEMKLQVSQDNFDMNHYIPLFSATGGEKLD